jgi:hypothetical protein
VRSKVSDDDDGDGGVDLEIVMTGGVDWSGMDLEVSIVDNGLGCENNDCLNLLPVSYIGTQQYSSKRINDLLKSQTEILINNDHVPCP